MVHDSLSSRIHHSDVLRKHENNKRDPEEELPPDLHRKGSISKNKKYSKHTGQVKSVLQLSRGVLLWNKEGVETPEPGFYI